MGQPREDETVSTTAEISDLLLGFATTSTAVISDNLQRLPGVIGLRPFHRGSHVLVGRALTVRVAAGDNLFIHKALELVHPGDVLVVDGDGDCNRALIGEIMASIGRTRGAAGFVIDGAIRDSGAIQNGEFPIFARAVIHRGPYKNGPGAINVPVSIGGLVISPGDIVVGDNDGIVSFPVEGAAELLHAVRAQEKREEEMLKQIHEGTYQGAYGR